MRPAVTGTGCRRAMKSPCSGKPPSCTGTGITDNMHWILLRGLTRERAHWGDFPERLRAAFPDQHFHPLALPGTVIHSRQASPATVRAIRDQVGGPGSQIPGPVSVAATLTRP